MPRDPRPYITIHDGVMQHPKIESLSDKAFRTLMECWTWCARNRTDGRIRPGAWEQRGPARARTELIREGLADEHPEGGVQMHDYLEHQRSADEIEELSRNRSEAGRKGGQAKARRVASAKASAKASAVANPKQTRSKSVADSDSDKEIPTYVGSHVPVSNATADDSRGPVVDVSMVKLAKAYTDKVKLTNPGRVAAVCLNAIGAGYTQEQIRGGLTVLADEQRTVTADTLRIAMQGEAPKARGRPSESTGTTRSRAALDRAARYAAEDQKQIGAS